MRAPRGYPCARAPRGYPRDDDDDDVLLSFRLPSTGRVGGETTRRQMKRK